MPKVFHIKLYHFLGRLSNNILIFGKIRVKIQIFGLQLYFFMV